jgi:hypothetical protein
MVFTGGFGSTGTFRSTFGPGGGGAGFGIWTSGGFTAAGGVTAISGALISGTLMSGVAATLGFLAATFLSAFSAGVFSFFFGVTAVASAVVALDFFGSDATFRPRPN